MNIFVVIPHHAKWHPATWMKLHRLSYLQKNCCCYSKEQSCDMHSLDWPTFVVNLTWFLIWWSHSPQRQRSKVSLHTCAVPSPLPLSDLALSASTKKCPLADSTYVSVPLMCTESYPAAIHAALFIVFFSAMRHLPKSTLQETMTAILLRGFHRSCGRA